MLIQGELPINTHTENLKVNKLARKARHRRNFSAVQAATLTVSKVGKYFTSLPLPLINKKSVARKAIGAKKAVSESQMLKRAVGFVLFFLLITSFTPNIAFSESDYAADQFAYPAMGTSMIADDSGFIIPVNPQTGQSDRSAMSDKAVHVIQSGDTLSTVAEQYDLKTTTLMWENNLSKTSLLKVGHELVIPPVNGVTHTVKNGESLTKIATTYDVESGAIIKQNNLAADELVVAGDKIFVPGGKQIAPPAPTFTSTYRNMGTVRTEPATRIALEGTTAAPAAGRFIIYPTRGGITQGYHSWHRAVDIADPSKPPIWAAAGGTIIKASSGTWGGGYGNHVIIDHGNGMQTLYAHMDYLTVSNGQYVTQGEVIGRMGNTGRVYGRTGIHLHFEVRDNGVKYYPGNYW